MDRRGTILVLTNRWALHGNAGVSDYSQKDPTVLNGFFTKARLLGRDDARNSNIAKVGPEPGN
jgi:hypothetical protein